MYIETISNEKSHRRRAGGYKCRTGEVSNFVQLVLPIEIGL